ncbi:unnamed protein product [Dovyalis caffra]|uniref:Uncharacterized protein n=1 Tax=Dovyalis caffra TaxID=77055 RepID=A0AAV1R2D8_9ROSI|nr:unnamed protein product [Dovyalis caffra]
MNLVIYEVINTKIAQLGTYLSRKTDDKKHVTNDAVTHGPLANHASRQLSTATLPAKLKIFRHMVSELPLGSRGLLWPGKSVLALPNAIQ